MKSKIEKIIKQHERLGQMAEAFTGKPDSTIGQIMEAIKANPGWLNNALTTYMFAMLLTESDKRFDTIIQLARFDRTKNKK